MNHPSLRSSGVCDNAMGRGRSNATSFSEPMRSLISYRFKAFALLLSLMLAAFGSVSAFAPPTRSLRILSTSRGLQMVPKYDPSTQRWSPGSPDEEAEAYGPIGSLIRAGPLPFIQRIINPDNYEQGVLKYMAQEGVDRMVRVVKRGRKICLFPCL